ncbi:MAG: hypothetical protein WC449_05170 [Candidatus Paceibacterota bacterium]
MKKFVDLVHSDFQLTVRTWKNSGRLFSKTVKAGVKITRGEVLTGSKKYSYVNDGTKAHYIAPVRSRFLRFKSGYTPKTQPGNIMSRNGGSSGNYVYSKGHWVKGIQARRFDKEIKNLREKDFLTIMEKALFVEEK